MENNQVTTIFGKFVAESKRRLDLTFDYETCAIRSFKGIASHLSVTQVVDIGANVGVYSVYLHENQGVTRVHAFEPAPAAFDLLKKNIDIQSQGSKITAYDLALSSQAGEIDFLIVSPLSGVNRIVPTGAQGDLIKVHTARLDDVLQTEHERIAVKIDVEGHEVSVLEGARQFLQENHCYLQIEMLSAEAVLAAKAVLRDLGYIHIFTLQDDYLFIHSELLSDKDALLEIIQKNLSADLHDLRQLRLEKRTLAAKARQLWAEIGYKKDPLFDV